MTQSKPFITQTTRLLPFDQLPWDDFERLCLMLLPRESFDNPQHYGAAGGEQGRDIVAYRDGDLWYMQCKQVKRCGPKVLLDEIEKVQGLMEEDPDLRPVGMLFIASCDISANARDRANKRCRELGLVCEVWGRTDLDARVQKYPDIVRTFFGWQHTRPLGTPFQAPAVPRYFVPRPEVSQALMDYLTAEAPPGALVVSAVHGLGGIGKTTLVAALAHAPNVQACFPDGVLWAKLGQQPDVLSLLAGWIQALGDYDFRPTVVEMASSHLRTLMHDKACLLVVDDAWQADHARPFLVGGAHCRLVITTRNAALARKVGARLYDLDVMTEAQALALFQARLGPLDDERAQAAALARELGYLPLALELAAAQVEAGFSWAELLDAFRQALADLATLDLDEATYRNESLRLSFRLSLEQLSPDDRDAFAWLGVLPEDVRLNPTMAATLWDQREVDARKRLRRLRDRALLKSVGDERYTLHDLLHDEAKLRLAERMPLPEAHAALLERYREKAPDKQWHRLPDGGYVHERLTWHMEQAGQPEAIHALLREETTEGKNGWYQAREALGQTAGYLDDVRRAWRLSDEEFAIRHSPLAIGLQCRYALIIASLNSLARNIPPALLVALVEKGVWTPAQGLAYAQQVPDLGQRVGVLVGLVPHLQGDKRDEALEKAMGAAQAIGCEGDRITALVELAPRLAELGYPQRALTAAREIENAWGRAKVLTRLVPYLPVLLRGEALWEAQVAAQKSKIERQWDQWEMWDWVEVLVSLAFRLVEPLLREALAAVRKIWGKGTQVWTLAGLREALTAAREIENLNDRATALSSLAPYLPGTLLRETLTATQEIQYDGARTKALAGLAPHLPEPLLREALVVAQEIRDIGSRVETLVELAPYLPQTLLQEALAAAQEIQSVDALTGLAPYLPEAERIQALREALAAARAIRWEYRRAEALARLASHLSEPLLREALAVAREIKQAKDRARALAGLTPYLPEPLRGKVLQETLAVELEIWNDVFQKERLARLAHQMVELGCCQEALAAALRIQDASERAETLAELVPHLPEPLKREALREALAVARAIKDVYWWPQALAKLAHHLPEPLRGEVLQEALATVAQAFLAVDKFDFGSRARALARLAPHLSESLREEAFRGTLIATRKIENDAQRAWILAELAPYLPEPLRREVLREALAAVQEIRYDSYGGRRAGALAKLAPHLPELLMQEALAVARKIGNEYERAQVLVRLATRLAELGYSQEALRVAQEIRWADYRAKALVGLALHLSEPLKGEVLRESLATARTIESEERRSEVLVGLASHVSEPLKGEALQESLAAARTIESEERRSEALFKLAPRLAEFGYLSESLAAAQEIRGGGDLHGSRLSRLVYQLVELGYLQGALTVARRIEVADSRSWSLSRLIPRLTKLSLTKLYPLWCKTLPILAAYTRKDLLADLRALEPVIASLGRAEAVAETFRAIQDVGRWWP